MYEPQPNRTFIIVSNSKIFMSVCCLFINRGLNGKHVHFHHSRCSSRLFVSRFEQGKYSYVLWRKKTQKIKVAWNFWSFCLDNSQTSVVIKTATLYIKTTTAIKNTTTAIKNTPKIVFFFLNKTLEFSPKKLGLYEN